jgi:hypothetical protein
VLCFTPSPALSCAARSSKNTWKRRVGEGNNECRWQTLLPPSSTHARLSPPTGAGYHQPACAALGGTVAPTACTGRAPAVELECADAAGVVGEGRVRERMGGGAVQRGGAARVCRRAPPPHRITLQGSGLLSVAAVRAVGWMSEGAFGEEMWGSQVVRREVSMRCCCRAPRYKTRSSLAQCDLARVLRRGVLSLRASNSRHSSKSNLVVGIAPDTDEGGGHRVANADQ